MCGDSAWKINKEAAEAEVFYQCPDDDGGGVGFFGEVAVAAFSKYGRGGAEDGLWWTRTTAR